MRGRHGYVIHQKPQSTAWNCVSATSSSLISANKDDASNDTVAGRIVPRHSMGPGPGRA
jgi:hypothetical protein